MFIITLRNQLLISILSTKHPQLVIQPLPSRISPGAIQLCGRQENVEGVKASTLPDDFHRFQPFFSSRLLLSSMVQNNMMQTCKKKRWSWRDGVSRRDHDCWRKATSGHGMYVFSQYVQVLKRSITHRF